MPTVNRWGLGWDVGRGMRLGLLDSRILFPFFHPTSAGVPENRHWQLSGAAPGVEAELCRRCTVRLPALFALSPLTTDALNGVKEWSGCVGVSPPGRDEPEEAHETSGVRKKRKNRLQQQGQGVRPLLHMKRTKDAGATSILVVSSLPKTKAELDSKVDPRLLAPRGEERRKKAWWPFNQPFPAGPKHLHLGFSVTLIRQADRQTATGHGRLDLGMSLGAWPTPYIE